MQRSDECQNDTPSSAGTTYPTDTYRVTYCNTLAPSRDDRAPARPHPVATLASRDITFFAAEATVRAHQRGNHCIALPDGFHAVAPGRWAPSRLPQTPPTDKRLSVWRVARLALDVGTSGYVGYAPRRTDHPRRSPSDATDRAATVALRAHGARARRHQRTAARVPQRLHEPRYTARPSRGSPPSARVPAPAGYVRL